MPQLVCFKTQDHEGLTVSGHASSVRYAERSCAEDGYRVPIFVGQLEYSYKKSEGVIIQGRRPIGPRRSASQRQKRRV